MSSRLVAGSRESRLALVQTEGVIATLQNHFPELTVDLKTYQTIGDINLTDPLNEVGDKGVFVKELETALLNREIDFAVHSMKDMPGVQPEGLAVIPFGKRDWPNDAWVSNSGTAFWDLPAGSVVGTSSLRRQAVLKHHRPDLKYESVRGNVGTRLKKLDSGKYDALVLAGAGLHRLGLADRITHLFETDILLPACSQGTLGIEYRNTDSHPSFYETYCQALSDTVTQVCDAAERQFLKTLQGGCQVPMAAYADQPNSADGSYRLRGLLCNPETAELITAEVRFEADNAVSAGEDVARQLLSKGGKTLLIQLGIHSE